MPTTQAANFEAGRRFERELATHLRGEGYYVVKSPGSKGAVDMVAVKPGQILFVQAKRNGVLRPAEWNGLYDLAAQFGAVPVLAERGFRQPLQLWQLTARKSGDRGRRQPMIVFRTDELAS